ncbi:DNA polymerase-3 subunit epsilon [Allobranchiibius huperziae]|uniref:DNA polymerase-3 subunit epsilon n=1 Tax=Allobranchiibius huperziae TaxID=1874116 RepID=A0A853DER4_9MICO|nr:DNA polymerase-3 subunit epsilon [Allobranchiibius huperziae]
MILDEVTGPLGSQVSTCYPHDYAVVDVETTGLVSSRDRVVQIAVTQMRSDGAIGESWSTLIDPERDPGPTHIHGLTASDLRGAPKFRDVAAPLADLLYGRVLVAHNAKFDWSFLQSEYRRGQYDLAIERRLCTVALSRRLNLNVPNLTLGTLANYWGLSQHRAHDAVDDVRVLLEVLRLELVMAYQMGLDLPLTIDSRTSVGSMYPSPAPRAVKCPWLWPGAWQVGQQLVQGMKVVITGPTALDRSELMRDATAAGLDVMNSVSSRTSLVICNSEQSQTRKFAQAIRLGIPLITEPDFRRMLGSVRPGTPLMQELVRMDTGATDLEAKVERRVRSEQSSRATPAPAPDTQVRPADNDAVSPQNSIGPGDRVLVLGGSHEQCLRVRRRVMALGAQPAVRLTASITHVVMLARADHDPRLARAREMGPCMLRGEGLVVEEPARKLSPQERTPHDRPLALPGGVQLPRGGVIDLPDGKQFALTVEWDSNLVRGEVDVVGFVLDQTAAVGCDEDFVFYNQPAHPSGAIALGLDISGEVTAEVDPACSPNLAASELLHRSMVTARSVTSAHSSSRCVRASENPSPRRRSMRQRRRHRCFWPTSTCAATCGGFGPSARGMSGRWLISRASTGSTSKVDGRRKGKKAAPSRCQFPRMCGPLHPLQLTSQVTARWWGSGSSVWWERSACSRRPRRWSASASPRRACRPRRCSGPRRGAPSPRR